MSKELDTLQKIYLIARNDLLNTIINAKGVGTKTYYNTVLQQVNKELAKLQKASDSYISTEIPGEYKKALDETYDYFQKNHLLMKPPGAFASLHTEAIELLAREMQYNIRQGHAQVGRQILRYLNESQDEALRAAGVAASAEKAAGGRTILDMKKNMISKLQTEGFMTVQYGAGEKAYHVSLDSYTMLCARSTTREAGNLARENQLIANGYDLVEMTSHFPTCEVCASLQGRIYSISGNDKRFPPLSVAFSSGYHNVHPNCRHSVHPWIEDFKTPDEVKAAMEQSGQPFADNRGEKEKGLYNKQQVENRQTRQDLYQYERYKAKLGSDAPKSFSAFRKAKKADGEKWSELQSQYKKKE